jgi:hypothetical protein
VPLWKITSNGIEAQLKPDGWSEAALVVLTPMQIVNNAMASVQTAISFATAV